MAGKLIEPTEEDLGLDDVETFQEFTPYNRKIKLNRLVKSAIADAISDSKEVTVKKNIIKPSKPSPPVASFRPNKENGNTQDENSR